MCGFKSRLLCVYFGLIVISFLDKGVVCGGLAEAPTCLDSTWVEVHRSCMKFVKTEFLSWNDAREKCKLLGGDLLVINDRAELNAVKKPFTSQISSMSLLEWWIGLEYVGNMTDGDWYWINNEPYIDKLPKWAPGEPSDESNTRCAIFEYQYKLNDKRCELRKPYICEQIVVTPSPSTSTSTSTTTTTTTTSRTKPSTSTVITVSTDPSVEKSSSKPTGHTTDKTTEKPIGKSTEDPTEKPTGKPTNKPTGKPTGKPTETPNGKPTDKPTGQPTDTPTGKPTDKHTGRPTDKPTDIPTEKPTGKPTDKPTGRPTDKPPEPTDKPTGKPTDKPSGKPTDKPNGKPTDKPTGKPTDKPNGKPTDKPTDKPKDKSTETPVNATTPKPKEFDFTGCYAVNHGNTCPAVEAFGISWPETEPGKQAKVQCENGQAMWKCDKNPTCWRGEPNVKQCTSEKIQELTKQLEEIEGEEEIESDQAIEFTENLSTTLESEEVLSEQDMYQSTKLMDAAKKAKPTNSSSAKSIVKNVLKCGSTLVSKENEATWKSMTPENKRTIASSLLSSVESVSMEMIKAFDEPGVENIVEDNMVMELQVVNVNEMHPDEELKYKGAENAFSIPSENLKAFTTDGLARMVFIDYDNVAELLDTSNQEDKKSLQIISKVTSASISNKIKEQTLEKPISFTFKTSGTMGQENWRQLCSYWDFDQGYTGLWSQKGCSFWSSNNTHTTCRCDHLTNFAVLLDVHKVEVAEVHATTLSYITYVGIIISIVCLFLSWVTFICLSSKCTGGLASSRSGQNSHEYHSSEGSYQNRAVQGERNSIHKHLVFCLFIAEVLFLAGIERTDNKVACAIIAGFLHFFFLGSFTWMFIEGIHILFMLVQVFDAAKSRMRYYYMFGYGCPLIAVGVSALVNHEGYGTEKYCWLSTERWFIWSFAGPVAVILLVNLLILIYAMAAVCKHSEYVFTKGKSSNFKGWIQGALALEVLLGLTWIFGYFYIDEQAIVMAYLFTVFNSLQGVFIFIFHCILNKKVRKEYERFIDYKSRTSTQTSSKCGNGSAGSGGFPPNGTRKQSGFLDLTNSRTGRSGSTTSV